MNELSDAALMALVKQGDMKSFEIIYNRHKAPMFTLACKILRDRSRAEDCVHNLFLHLYQKSSLYQPTGSFPAWLNRMANNLILDYLRKEKRQATVSIDAAPDSDNPGARTLSEMLADPTKTPSQIASDHQASEALQLALTRLSPEDRQILVLCDIEEKSREEVAADLGIKLGTLTVRLHRARKKLITLAGFGDAHESA